MNRQLATMRSLIDSKMSSEGSVALITDIRPLVANCVTDIFTQSAMGVQLNVQTGLAAQLEDSHPPTAALQAQMEYPTAVHGYLDLFIQRLMRPWLYPNVLFRFSSLGRKSARYVGAIRRFTNEVISKRKKVIECQLQEEDTLEESMKAVGGNKRLAFLDLLLVQHFKGTGAGQFSLVDVYEEVCIFLAAGTDTTVTALQFALLLIGLHPEKQVTHNSFHRSFASPTLQVVGSTTAND